MYATEHNAQEQRRRGDDDGEGILFLTVGVEESHGAASEANVLLREGAVEVQGGEVLLREDRRMGAVEPAVSLLLDISTRDGDDGRQAGAGTSRRDSRWRRLLRHATVCCLKAPEGSASPAVRGGNGAKQGRK